MSNVSVSTLASMLVFICLFTIPLYFQFVRGDTASQSGIFVTPFMLASALGNITGSKWAQHFGTMRGILRIAAALSFVGLLSLFLLSVDAPVWAVIVGMVTTGLGVGICLIGSMTSAQNALRPEDIGSGTGALLVLRSVGGASGSTLAGTVIASGTENIRQAAAAGVQSVEPGMRGPTGHLSHGTDVASAAASLAHSFGLVYAIAATVAAICFLVTLKMPDALLRSSSHPGPMLD